MHLLIYFVSKKFHLRLQFSPSARLRSAIHVSGDQWCLCTTYVQDLVNTNYYHHSRVAENGSSKKKKKKKSKDLDSSALTADDSVAEVTSEKKKKKKKL